MISRDFIKGSHESEGDTKTIVVVVDGFSNLTRFIGFTECATTSNVAQAFAQDVWNLHGLAEHKIFDRESKQMCSFCT
jgi:hypothetical protein